MAWWGLNTGWLGEIWGLYRWANGIIYDDKWWKQRERAWGGSRKLTKDNKVKEGESDMPKKKQKFLNKLKELLNERSYWMKWKKGNDAQVGKQRKITKTKGEVKKEGKTSLTNKTGNKVSNMKKLKMKTKCTCWMIYEK
jgi:hypothetical protein